TLRCGLAIAVPLALGPPKPKPPPRACIFKNRTLSQNTRLTHTQTDNAVKYKKNTLPPNKIMCIYMW
ncbi:hypothetical protein, partial [Enterobacter hormaechei]